MRTHTSRALAVAALAAVCAPAFGTLIVSLATNNATVWPTGPRTGTNGKIYFDVEGSSNGTGSSGYACYGVADFNGASYQGIGKVGDVTSATLELFQADASFTKNSTVQLWWTANTNLNINSGNTVKYNYAAGGESGLDSSVWTSLQLLGSASFVQVKSGHEDDYTLSLTATAKAGIISAINSGSDIRFIVSSDNAGGAATWAGYSSTSYSGPKLALNVAAVPEPATIAILTVGVVGLIRRRRSR